MTLSILLLAAIELVAPMKDETVILLPERQRDILKLETLEAREKYLAEFRAKTKSSRQRDGWRTSKPLIVKWQATAGEMGPWRIRMSKNADLSDAQVFVFKGAKTDEVTGRTEAAKASRNVAYALPYANLEIATRYYWQVSGKTPCGKCPDQSKCECKKHPPRTISAVGSFVTEDFAPRWIQIEGRVGNFRDLGGRIGLNGRRIRQGLVFRSQGLNDNSPDGQTPGRNRLMVEDVKLLAGKWGIRTDLDLRSSGEVAGMNGVSPLGKDIKYINNASCNYKWIFIDDGKARMAKNFRVFLDEANYPILFHCIGGADRTGALAYVMNGVLGVSRREIETDWESTFYPNIPDRDKDGKLVWNSERHFNEGFAKYGTSASTWNERIILYLKDCGITDAEIEKFRSIMLEK